MSTLKKQNAPLEATGREISIHSYQKAVYILLSRNILLKFSLSQTQWFDQKQVHIKKGCYSAEVRAGNVKKLYFENA